MDSERHTTATKGSTLPSVDPPLSGAKRPREKGHGGEAAEGIIPESASQHHLPQQRRQQQPAISSTSNSRGHDQTAGGGRASGSPKCPRGLPAAAKKAPGTPGAAAATAAAAAAAPPSPAVESATAATAGAAKPLPVGATTTAPVGDFPSGAEAGSGASASHVAEAPAVQMCQVCGEKERRYCCPRCGKLTCSLPCYKRHKKEEGCNGKRDKVAFVGLQDFTDAHLRSDFNFLEDAIRCVDGGRRELARRPGVLGTPSKQQRNAGRGGARGRGRGRGRQQQQRQDHGDEGGPPGGEQEGGGDGGALGLLSPRGQGWLSGRTPRLQRLVKEAAMRGTRLLLMPDGMARRDGNTSSVAGAPGRGRRFSTRGRGGRGRGGGGRGGGGGRQPAVGVGGGDGGVDGRGQAGIAAAGAAVVVVGGGGGAGAGAGGVDTSRGPAAAAGVGGDGPGQAAAAAAAAGERTPTVPNATAEPSGAPASNGPPAATGGARKPSVPSPSPPTPTPSAVAKPASRELLELENTSPRGSSIIGIETGGGGGGGGGGSGVGQSVRPTSTLLWKVEWVFCTAVAVEGRCASGAGGGRGRGDADVTVSDPTVSEELSLLEAVAKHLEPRPGNAPLRHRLKLFTKPWGEAAAAATAAKTSGVASRMAATGRAQKQQLRLFLQRVPCAAKRPLYWELDGGEPLGIALKGKTVIEHPTVYVTVDGKEATERFPTLVTDLESNDDIAEDPSRVIGELERAMAPPVPAAASLAAKEGLAPMDGLTPMDATSSEEADGDGSSSSSGSSSSESESESSSSSSSEEDDASDDDNGDEER